MAATREDIEAASVAAGMLPIALGSHMIETSTVFLPSRIGAMTGAIGVSIGTSVVGKSRHTSYARSMLISRSRFRKVLVLVSFERISESLC